MSNLRQHILLILLIVFASTAYAQQYAKMSRMVSQAFLTEKMREKTERQSMDADKRKLAERQTAGSHDRSICAFVRVKDDGSVLERNGCRSLAQWGDIHIADIPLHRLPSLSNERSVLRIEAKESCQLHLDTTIIISRTAECHKPVAPLQQAFTGKGVVMGIQDIGFDLTHPTFYSSSMDDYRIRRFWDMLDPDSVGSGLYVGRDYTSAEQILAKAYATDGLKQAHGTHTAAIAAGSGAPVPDAPPADFQGFWPMYKGMAPDADLCLVANAVGEDREFVSEEDWMKYTTATDMLGFKYIFDYAQSVGKPCVISFSEGAYEDLYGECQLMYEVLEQMVGPGRIIVASAGNQGVYYTYLHKAAEQQEVKGLLRSNGKNAFYQLRLNQTATLSLGFFNSTADRQSYDINLDHVLQLPDSLLMDTINVLDKDFAIAVAAYPTCYDEDLLAVELLVSSLGKDAVGASPSIDLTLRGEGLDAECFATGGFFIKREDMPEYNLAESSHNIHFPSAAASVICVGNSAWRQGFLNYKGVWYSQDRGTDGVRTPSSSTGPTMQGNVKPDIMAPGMNVISAFSSYLLEADPNHRDADLVTRKFTYGGREYSWVMNSGTSMSAPVVGGIIALWLEANPSLSPADVMGIFEKMATHEKNNEYGWGEIDAYGGLLHALQLNKVEDISMSQPSALRIRPLGKSITIEAADVITSPVSLTAYDVLGRIQWRHTLHPGQDRYVVDTYLPMGVYAIQCTSANSALHGSTLIRITE